MREDAKNLIKDIEQWMKLPRENGELMFHNPWESRIFAMAVLLSDKGMYPWKAFNGEFVKEIEVAERTHPSEDVVSSYYILWREAFEKVLLEQDLITGEQLKARADEFASGQRHHVC